MIALLYPMIEEVGGELISNREVRSLLVGVGEKSTQAIESLSSSVSLATLLGTAGVLDAKLKVGDVVVVDNYVL